MEKIKVNNQVVDMRKHVKQAKIHIINKLTKEVKLLQNRKGNEVQVQKAKRKAERFLEEIAIIKKTKPDDISKLALVKAKNWKEILQQKNLPLQERCTAMLANYEPVQKAVEAFHNANKDLALKLEDLIKQWEEKKKLTKNLPKNKKLQKNSNKNHMKSDGNALSNTAEKLELSNKSEEENKLPSNKKLKMTKESKVRSERGKSVSEKPEENIISNQISAQKLFTENDEADSTINSDKLNNNHDPTDSDDSESDNEMLNSEPNAENTLKIISSSPNKNSVDDKINDEDLPDEQNLLDAEEMNSTNDEGSPDEENSMDDEEPTNSDKSENEKESKESKNADKVTKLDVSEHLKKYSNNNSKNKLKEIALLNLDELQDLDEIPIGNADVSEESDENKTSEDETNDTVEGKEEDSFFLRCSGDSDEDNDDSSKQKDFLQKSDRFIIENADAREVKPKFFEAHKSPRERNHKGSFQKFPGQKKSFVPFKNETQQSRNSKFMSKNFHDRFQNKNKSFGKPYGSKIEHKNYPSKESCHMKKNEKKTGGLYHRQSFENSVVKNKAPLKKGVTSDKPLHPSWEAKRKQKEIINTQFQGKRMVFDD